MATTRPTKKCIDCGKVIEPKGQSDQWQETGGHDACNDCFDYWGHENGHSDGGHETILEWMVKERDLDPWMQEEVGSGRMRGCRVCQGREEGPAEGPEKMTEPADSGGWHSHKGHGHPLTQAARARCRRQQQRAGQG
jgi:hypothetical protein